MGHSNLQNNSSMPSQLPQEQSFESFTTDPSSNAGFSEASFATDYSSTGQYLDPNLAFTDFTQLPSDSHSFQSGSGGQSFLQPHHNIQSQQDQSYGQQDQTYGQQAQGYGQQDQGFEQQEQGYGQQAYSFSQSNQLNPNNLTLDTSGQQPTNMFPAFDYSNQSLDPSLLGFGQSQDQQQQQQTSLDPTNLSFDSMAAMQQQHPPTPPHLLQPEMRRTSQASSPRQTPSPHQQQMYGQPARPRTTSESLAPPLSAAFPHGYLNGGNPWDSGAAFRTHRRAPSDALSEVSSHSAQASPYMANLDGFDSNVQHISPLINPQHDQPLFTDSLSFNQFTLNDPNSMQNHISPGHSPLVSPQVSTPQKPLPEFSSNDNFGITADIGQFGAVNANDYDMIPPMSQEGMAPMINNVGLSGEADTMSPPEINIDFAPPSRQPSFRDNQNHGFGDALSPPENTVRRKRAKSDSTFARSPSPGVPARGRSPSLQPNMNGSQPSLSPANIHLPPSRSPSPASSAGRGRSSSASGTREHMLDLANRERSALGGSSEKRQKHEATFQCTLCPKRFTRAYNLRSHLRTHTDERPFVCTVCGKAFARQHDRKRHEGLHSGEKKFVCRGYLKSGQEWGCKRSFARADALGRHFRSEAGRKCIGPLLDEEAAERQKNWAEDQAQQQMHREQGFVAPGPVTQRPQLDHVLPAALLQMYPEFANLNWGAMDTAPNQAMDEDFNGRSSFDASSGNEWDVSDNDMTDFQVQSGAPQQFGVGGTVSAQGGWNSGEYLSDFEGR